MSKRKGDPGYPAGWCIHYRSSHSGETFTDCEAGIPFAVWNATKFDARPCFLDKDGQSKPRCSDMRSHPEANGRGNSRP